MWVVLVENGCRVFRKVVGEVGNIGSFVDMERVFEFSLSIVR